jgi:hypothetical protein
MFHLHQSAGRYLGVDLYSVQLQHDLRRLSVGLQLPRGQVHTRALGKAEHEHRPFAGAEKDDRPVSARSALTPPRDSLLHDAATQIGIYQAVFGSTDGVNQGGIGDVLLAGKLLEPAVLEDAQGRAPVSV